MELVCATTTAACVGGRIVPQQQNHMYPKASPRAGWKLPLAWVPVRRGVQG